VRFLCRSVLLLLLGGSANCRPHPPSAGGGAVLPLCRSLPSAPRCCRHFRWSRHSFVVGVVAKAAAEVAHSTADAATDSGGDGRWCLSHLVVFSAPPRPPANARATPLLPPRTASPLYLSRSSPSSRRFTAWRCGFSSVVATYAAAYAAAAVRTPVLGLFGGVSVGLAQAPVRAVGARRQLRGRRGASWAMPPKVGRDTRVQLLHQLLLTLLGVNTSSLPLDVVELVASLFQILHELEVRVPSLHTHFHVSGVSKTTGRSFFVIIRDDALSKSGAAKRVVRSVYTYLHGEASMLTTASAWEQWRDDHASAAAGALLPGVAASAPARASAAAEAAADGLPVGATGAAAAAAASSAAGARSPADGGNGDDSERPRVPRFGPELDALNYDPEGDANAAAVVCGTTLSPPNPPSDGGMEAPPAPRLPQDGAWQMVMAPRYVKPTLHHPTRAAKLYIEALFSASKGFAGVLRATMSKVRLKVLVRHGLASNSSIMVGLNWWPATFPADVLATLGVATITSNEVANQVNAPESADADTVKKGEGHVLTLANVDTAKESDAPASANPDVAKEDEAPTSANGKEDEAPPSANADTVKGGKSDALALASVDTAKESDAPASANPDVAKKDEAPTSANGKEDEAPPSANDDTGKGGKGDALALGNADTAKEGDAPASANPDVAKKDEAPTSANGKEDEAPASANADAAKEGDGPASTNNEMARGGEAPALANAYNTAQATKKGKFVSKCTYEVFPVLMEKRHLPINERSRDALDMETVVVHLSEIGVARQPSVSLVATSLMLLFDKEPYVKGVMDAKLAEYSKWVDLGDAPEEEPDLTGVTAQDLTNRGLVPPRLPRPPPPPPPPLLSNGGAAVDDAETVVRARLAARQAAVAASQAAAVADQAAKSKAASERRARKRSGAGPNPILAKRARQDGPTSALIMPSLEPAEEVVCLPLLMEASMLADHTYLTLATNWCVPVVKTVASEVELEAVTEENWRAVVQDQDGVECVLSADIVQSTRKRMMEMAEAMRSGNEVDPDQECPIVATAVLADPTDLVRLTMASVKAMGDLHVAANRLAQLRKAVTWMEAVAGLPNSRVPTFFGDKQRTTGAFATIFMRVVLDGGPTATVWRSGARPTAGGVEDVVVPAHLLVSNTGTEWMSDDVLFATLFVLQRWCAADGGDVFILHCSVFARLLEGSDDGVVDRIAVEVHGVAGKATRLAGICNIKGCHWVSYCIDLKSKTLTQYDSGAHFLDLSSGVDKAAKRVKALGKAMAELKDLAAIDEREAAAAAAAAGGVAMEDVEPGAAGGGASRKKIWSTQKVKTPQQPMGDNYSCGPLAFSFVWHWVRGEKLRVQATDCDAVRLAMLSAVVLDGVEQREALARQDALASGDGDGAAVQ